MKILLVTPSLDPAMGGPARSVPQLAAALAGRGHEVALWAPTPLVGNGGGRMADGEGRMADREGRMVDREERMVDGGLRVFSGSFGEVLDAFGAPDVVHDNGLWQPCHREVARVCRARGIKRAVAPRGMLEPWALNHKKWKKRLAWWLYQRNDLQAADLLHATAESEAAQLRKLGLKAPIVIAANGVAVPEVLDGEGRMADSEGRKLMADGGWGMAKNESSAISSPSAIRNSPSVKTALFLSRTHKVKGLPMLVAAWDAVRPEGWRMRVVGPDEDGHRAHVEALVNKAGLGNTWSFEDSLEGEEKWQAMAEADLFILPTHSENFGIVVAEALAARTPVLTTTGTPWQGLHEHDCGWWVEPTPQGITDGLRRALNRVEDFPQMGERGRNWVEQNFSWEGIAKTMEGAYRRMKDDG